MASGDWLTPAGTLRPSGEDEIICNQFSKVKFEAANRIDVRMGTAGPNLDHNAPPKLMTARLYFLLIASGLLWRLRLAWLTFLNPDEALHYFLARQPSLRLAYEASLTTAHPPLMVLFLHYWSLLGRSELFLRLPFVAAGTLFCWVMFLWIRSIASHAAACFALAIFLFMPSLISLSAEIRQYSFLLLFCAGCLYCLHRALENDAHGLVRWMFCSAACLYLALLTHYSAMIFAAAVGLYGLLSLNRKTWPASVTWAWIAGQAGALAICAFLYESQISKLRESGIPSEIASTWLRSSVFQPHQNNFLTFAWTNTIRLFRYFFSHGTIGVAAFALFVFAILALIWPSKNKDCRPRNRELAILLATPFLITLLLSMAGIYPYGGTRHDVVLAVFAIPGIAVGFDHLRVGGSGAESKLIKAALLLSAMLVCNFYPSPSGPYIRPYDQRRQLMDQAISAIRSLPPQSVLFTDAQGSMVLNFYLCHDAMPIPLTPQKSLSRMSCGDLLLIASMDSQTGFDRSTFPELLSEVRQENNQGATLYLFQSGWINDKQEEWLTELRGLGGSPRNFGPNILLGSFPR